MEIGADIEIHLFFILNQSSLDIEILSLKGKNPQNGLLSRETVLESIDQEIFNYLNNKVHIEIFIFNSYKLSDIKNYRLLIGLQIIIKSRNFQLLHFVGNNDWVVMLNLMLKKIPKLHTLHEPFPFTKESAYKLFRHFLRIKLLILFNRKLVVPSAASYAMLTKHFKIPLEIVKIIPFGPLEIYAEYASDKILKKENLILFYGNISPYKGIEILYAAMLLIMKANPRLELIIAGDGNIASEILRPTKNITIINRYLSPREIAELNQLASIVVCPYKSASQSGVVMTSFAFNNAVIGTNVGALPEAIENGVTGVIIEPNNPDLLCKTVIDLFQDQHKLEKMRDSIREKYKNTAHSWQTIAEQNYQLYEQQINHG